MTRAAARRPHHPPGAPVIHLLLIAGLATTLWTAPAQAEATPSSHLLLPYFEVDLGSPAGRTTLFAVGSSAEEPVDVRVSVTSNWGIPLVETTLTLAPGAVSTVNLRDWLGAGALHGRTMGSSELAHVQRALQGERSPRDGLYYGSAADPDRPELAVGAVTLQVVSTPRHDALWGDYFLVDPGQDFAEGDLLVDIDRAKGGCSSLCRRHRLRFLQGGGFDGGTQVVVWSGRRAAPKAAADPDGARQLVSVGAFHEESGMRFAERDLDLLAVDDLALGDLDLGESFGWLDLLSDEPVYVGVRLSANGRYGLTMQSWCVPETNQPPPEDPEEPEDPEDPEDPTPAIDLEKATDGLDADSPAAGPTLTAGDVVTWTYRVTNTGETPLVSIAVTDDEEGVIACPRSTLAAGEAMTCTARGVAVDGMYRNVGTVVGISPAGVVVDDSDPSHYRAGPTVSPHDAAIHLEKATNGHDADVAPGPTLTVGDSVVWSYQVTNVGTVGLVGVALTDDQGIVVSCPQSQLAIGEAMTCTGMGMVAAGQYRNVGTATGTSIADPAATVTDTDPSHYFGEEPSLTCGECAGKVTRLVMRYLGSAGAQVRVRSKRGPSQLDVFEGTVHPGGTFELVGPASGNGGFAGTLGTEIELFVGGVADARMHTSCSAPIGPGTVAGSFEVIEGESRDGGVLCPAP